MTITKDQFTATVTALLSELPEGFCGRVIFDVPRDNGRDVQVRLETAPVAVSRDVMKTCCR